MNPLDTPIAPGEPLPHRKVIRNWIAPLADRSTLFALSLVVLDFTLYGLALAGIILFDNLAVKILLGMVMGFIIGRLFILGHDACHQAFTDNRRLNRWVGRLLFLPSLTTYSLWETGHNTVHHGYSNLKGFDFVWCPKTPEEYRALSPAARALERIYRSGWGPWLYYLIEIWWKKMYFPNARQMPTRRRIFTLDSLLVTAGGIAWIAGLVWAASATGQSVWVLLLTGFVIPFIFWNGMIGMVIYIQHTHPEIEWYENKAEWAACQPFVSTTVHLTFKYFGRRLLHNIMVHTAHHVDMSVPLYKLPEAQHKLETMLPGRIVVQMFSWRWYFQCARYCKLYDFSNKQWLDFKGRPQPAFPNVNH
ncbi:MAG: fatty acid desaturase [Corticimicrobacter sp.]|uniref:fatty acid desaturase n=1 Tax=Corticimicrobacter sp. TaxID=2678536 RepID=UPI0032DB4684